MSTEPIEILQPTVDALTSAIDRARARGRMVYAARLVTLRASLNAAALADVERAVEELRAKAEQVTRSPSTKPLFVLDLPGMRTFAEANARMHHMQKHKTMGDIAPTVEMAMRANASVRGFKLPLPCVLRMTRLAPAPVDDGDNLAMTLKRVRDGVSRWMQLNDRSHLVQWVCRQEHPRPWGVRIEVLAL